MVSVLGLLIAVTSLVDGGLQGALALVVEACGLSGCSSWALEHRLSNCGTRALLLCGTGIFPDQGSTPLSPEKAGRFPTTGPQESPPQVPRRINVSSNGKPRQRAPGLPGSEAQQHFRLKSCWSQGYSVTGKNKSNSTLHLLLCLTPCSAACASKSATTTKPLPYLALKRFY